MNTRNLSHTPRSRRGRLRLLAVLGSLALLAGITVPLYASAAPTFGESYEGWRHISTDAAADSSVSYDRATHAFAFHAANNSKEALLLNADFGDGMSSSAENTAAFGKGAMRDFVVEYDVELTTAGLLEFAFLNAPPNGDYNGDLSMASLAVGHGDSHAAVVWSRGAYWIDGTWVQLEGNGWNDLGGFYGSPLTGAGRHHVKLVKEGWNLTLTLDDQAPQSIAIPSDKGLPESGYMGFYAQNAEGVLSNVTITNSATDETMEFFTAPKPKKYEGWLHLSKDAAETPSVSYDEDTHAFTFLTKDSGSAESLILNADFDADRSSSTENTAAFGKGAMRDFVVEYDVKLTASNPGGNGGGTLDFVFMNAPPNEGYNGDLSMASLAAGHSDSHAAVLWSRGSYWINGDWVQLEGNGYQDLGGFYGSPLTDNRVHHVKLTKEGWDLTLKLDDQVAFATEIPSDKGLPESGYIGFYAKGMDGVISNVTITNSTTDTAADFFKKPESPAPPDPPAGEDNQYEGWAHVSKDAAEAPSVSYDEDTRAFTFRAKDSGSIESLFLNADFGTGKNSSDENLASFGKEAMQDFVVEYDVELTETRPGSEGGGMLEFAFLNTPYIEEYEGNLFANSITVGHTDSHAAVLWHRGVYWINDSWVQFEGNGWSDLGGVYGNPLAGTGLHHVKLTKEGRDVSLQLDGGIPFTTEIPEGAPASGYIGFYAKNADGVISNVKVTNSTTGETAVFFGEGSSFVPDSSQSVVDLEGWSGFCNQPSAVSHYYQRDGEGALFFDGMTCEADFLYLNSPYGTSEAAKENAAKFGVDAMGDFTVDFDFSLRDLDSNSGGALNFVLAGESESNPGMASTVLQMNGSATALKYEYHTIGNYSLLPGTNPDNVLVSNDAHHVTIQKAGRSLTVTIDGYAVWEDYTLPETIVSNNGQADHPAPDSGYIAFWFRKAKGYIANVKVTNDTTQESKTFFEDYGKSLEFWEMGGGDTTNLLAVTPEKGKGVYAESTGEFPDNTTLKYLLPLDLTDLTFTFVPKAITTVEFDKEAWMGFALTDTDKDYNPEVPAKSAGFVAEIQTKDDGSAVITFKSLLQGETYGTHTVSCAIDSFRAGTAYTFGTRYTDAGLEVYLDGQKIAGLDWLKGVYRNGLGYLTTTASCTDGFPQAWAVMAINGKEAIAYDSGLFDDGFEEEDPPGGNSNSGGDNSGSSGEDNPDTGVGFPAVVPGLLPAAALTLRVTGIKRKRKG